MQQLSPPLQCDDRFTHHLRSLADAPQVERHRGQGHRGDCYHLPIGRAAADSHPHPRCFQLPQLLTELALPGKVFAASRAPHTPSHQGDEYPVFVVIGEALEFVAVGQALEVVGVGYGHAPPGLAHIA